MNQSSQESDLDKYRLGFPFTMAFQPIVNFDTSDIFAHEALVRGVGDEPASQVLANVTPDNAQYFDQACRAKAIELAVELDLETRLCINFQPGPSKQLDARIAETLQTAQRANVENERLIFEIVRSSNIADLTFLANVLESYQGHGFSIALDDFGISTTSLNTLKTIRPDFIKLDISLIQDLHKDKTQQSLMRGIVELAQGQGCEVIAEGVEHSEDLECLLEAGVSLMQGFHFARPSFETLTDIDMRQHMP